MEAFERTVIRIILLTLIFLLSVSLNSFALETSGQATVKAESMIVYSGMSTRSDIVKTFKKGDTVIVELEIDGSEAAWCGVKETGQIEISGFALCENLERVKASTKIPCYWTINAAFDGDASGKAIVNIPCKGMAADVSVSSNYGNYNNIPVDAFGDGEKVIIRSAGVYGKIAHSGSAKGNLLGDAYSGTWKVKLMVETGERTPRHFSGDWRGIGNYSDSCKIDACLKE